MVYKIDSPEQTEALGRTLAAHLADTNVKRAFITLDGEMGVGKTVFCRGFASHFGITGVKSPTYTVVNEYRSADGTRIFHFDLYRIEDEDDLWSVGFWDLLDESGIVICEWSERIPSVIPEDAVRVTITRGEGDDDRVITFENL